jgi:hypothetical protein
MTSREERERRRAERLAAEQKQHSAERRRLLLGYVVAGALTLAVVVGIVIAVAGSGGGDGEEQVGGEEIPEQSFIKLGSGGELFGYEPDAREGTPPPELAQGDLEKAAQAAGCELRLDLRDEGSTHIQQKSDAPDYETNPPTSGDHWGQWLADGAFSEYPDPIYSVHTLEHGRIEIQYSPDLPEAEQLELKGLFDEDPNAMLFFPNPEMPYEVAATAWTQMIGCESYEGAATIDALRAFRDIYRGQGPENFPVVVEE